VSLAILFDTTPTDNNDASLIMYAVNHIASHCKEFPVMSSSAVFVTQSIRCTSLPSLATICIDVRLAMQNRKHGTRFGTTSENTAILYIIKIGQHLT